LKKNEGEKGDQEILVEKNHRQRGREREERWEGGIDKKTERREKDRQNETRAAAWAWVKR
jgi:hypothetical protein